MTKREWAEMIIEDLNADAFFIDGHDDAIIGVVAVGNSYVVAYDELAIVRGLGGDDEAWDFYGYNILGANLGADNGPIFVRTPETPPTLADQD